MSTNAKIITDVISPTKSRLTIFEIEFHRFVLAEVNTHRMASRSSASSRAIPVVKMLQRAVADPAMPVLWAREQPGMQGGAELEGTDLADAQALLQRISDFTTSEIGAYIDRHPEASTRLHKSLLNRPMEWFQYHKVIIGATDDGWANFFAQRATRNSPLAQPELRAVVDLMLDLYESNEPSFINYGEWTTPYTYPGEEFDTTEDRMEISVARCARVSYLNHDGVRDLEADFKLYNDLVSAKPMHAAPLEFVATPLVPGLKPMGNFTGYRQYRHIVQGLVKA
jgi:thymidylate synthase ThyX